MKIARFLHLFGWLILVTLILSPLHVRAAEVSENAEVVSSEELSSSTAVASGSCGSNLTWTLESNGTLSVSGTGPMNSYSSSSYGGWYGYRSSITSLVIENGVTSIGDFAFIYLDNLASVTISNTVTHIGESAFSRSGVPSITLPASVTSLGACPFGGCYNLTGISVSTDNPMYSTSDGVLFNKNKTSLVVFPSGRSGSYTVPSSVTKIGSAAFLEAGKLTSLRIPSSVTTISDYAFQTCTSLSSVQIASGLRVISEYAFSKCSSLTSIVLPDTLTTIGNYVFWNCGISSITVPASVTSIGTGAFTTCNNLQTVTFVGAAPSLGTNCFYGTTAICYYNPAKGGWSSVAQGNYGGSLSWISNSSSIANASITLSYTTYTYNGSAKKPTVTVIYSGKKLVSGTDYKVSYANNTAIGTASVTVTGTGNYYGSQTLTFKIKPATVSLSSVSNKTSGIQINWTSVAGAEGYYVYRIGGDVTSWKRIATVTGNSSSSYTDTSAASGTLYTYTVKAYKGSIVGSYNKTGLSLTRLSTPSLTSTSISSDGITVKWDKVTGAEGYYVYRKAGTATTWSKRRITSPSTLSLKDTSVTNGTKYTYTVRAYAGADLSSYVTSGLTRYFITRPDTLTLSSLSTGRLTVNWTTNTKATGYQIYYSTSSTFASNTKAKTVTGNFSNNWTCTGLTSKKKYYVKIRSTYTIGSSTYYSAWSAPKSYTVK